MNKKTIGIIIFLMFAFSNYLPLIEGVSEQQYDEMKMFESLIFSKPIIENVDDGKSISINIEGADSKLMIANEPILPRYNENIILPIGTSIKYVNITPKIVNKKSIIQNIETCPKPSNLGEINSISSESLKVNENPSNYYFPDKWYDYNIGCGLNENERVLFLTINIYPVRYSQVQDILYYAEEFDIEIIYQEPVVPIVFDDIYDLLIITTEAFSPYINTLVDHKIQRGITTKMVTIDDIKNSVYFPVNGEYNREKTKYFIKNAIENWGITYVLLIGGIDCGFTVCYSYLTWDDAGEEYFPCDLYYADIYDSNMEFASWDVNDNHLYGEYPDDLSGMDFYPDVYLGRLPCKNINEVEVIVNKIINYENNNFISDNALFIAGDTYASFSASNGRYDEGELTQEETLNQTNFNYYQRIWTPGGIPDSGDINLSKENITYGINIDNWDIINYCGHGGVNSWATHPHQNKEKWIRFLLEDLLTINETDKIPIIVSECCYNNRYTTLNVEQCFGWAITVMLDKGGIASFGNTGLSWIYTGKYVNNGLSGWKNIQLVKNLKNNKVLGEVMVDTLNGYISNFLYSTDVDEVDYKTVEISLLIGDPSLNKINSEDNYPEVPTKPTGKTNSVINKEVNYSTFSSDIDGDNLYYLWDWGNNNYSDWIGPYQSGEECITKHIWTKPGIYNISVKCKDIWGAESDWSDPLSITMPKSLKMNQINNQTNATCEYYNYSIFVIGNKQFNISTYDTINITLPQDAYFVIIAAITFPPTLFYFGTIEFEMRNTLDDYYISLNGTYLSINKNYIYDNWKFDSNDWNRFSEEGIYNIYLKGTGFGHFTINTKVVTDWS